MKTDQIFETDFGLVELHGVARLLRDEVLGKLLHDNILVSMASVGFTPVALSAQPDNEGGLLAFYAVRLSADELDKLPSIYDPPPASEKKARKRRKK